MAYEKTTWVNGQAPALDAEHLNKMEQGIADAVSVTPQTLSDEQKAQARTNIGADTVQEAVLYTPQSLTDGQKTQARGNINAAPGGYGLGGNAKTLTVDDDLNHVLTTGWYQWGWNAHPKNAPDNHWGQYGCAMHVFSTVPGGYAIQTVYDLSDDITHGCAIQRTIYVLSSGNIYYPWEWVNPPMKLSVEYRTTERYLGKPVYVQAVNFGALPNAATKTVIWATADEVSAVLSVEAPGSQGAPVGLGASLSGTEITATTTTLYIKSSGDYSANTAVFRIKYTKTTD